MSATSPKEKLASLLDDNFITCDICAVMYSSADKHGGALKTPKTLECLHIFCRECLGKSIIKGATQIECFVCRFVTPLDPALGVETLKTNFMLQNLVATLHPSCSESVLSSSSASSSSTSSSSAVAVSETETILPSNGFEDGDNDDVCEHCANPAVLFCTQCCEVFCATCSEIHLKSKKFREHEMVSISSSKRKVNRKCNVHKSELIKFVCETCNPNLLCCTICLIDDGHQEKSHKLSSVEKYVARQREKMMKVCSEAENLLDAQRDLMVEVDERIQIHKSNLEISRSRISHSFDRIIEIVVSTRKAWLDELEIQGTGTDRILSADKKAVQIHISNAGLFIDRAKHMLESLSDIEFFEQCDKLVESLGNANEVLVAPFTLNNLSAIEGGDSESQLLLALTQVFHSNPFELPNKGAQRNFNFVGDTNGVLHYIGTQGGTVAYANPTSAANPRRIVASSSSDGIGTVDFIVGREDKYFRTDRNQAGITNQYVRVDLGEGRLLQCTHYTFKHGRSDASYMLRNWRLEGSVDGSNWVTLRNHQNDTTILTAFGVASFPITNVNGLGNNNNKNKNKNNNGIQNSDPAGYRYFQVFMTGAESQGSTYLHICSLELYGKYSFDANY